MSSTVQGVISECHGAEVVEVSTKVKVPGPVETSFLRGTEEVKGQPVKVGTEKLSVEEFVKKHGVKKATAIEAAGGKNHLEVGLYEPMKHDEEAVEKHTVCIKCQNPCNVFQGTKPELQKHKAELRE